MSLKNTSLNWIFLIFWILLPKLSADANNENPRETPVVKIVRENAASVVNISTERIVLLRNNPFWGTYGSDFDSLFDQFFGYYRPTRALKLKSVGSGVMIDKGGLIVTNAHVVHMASNIYVIFNDSRSVPGEVVYENPREDLALIKIDSSTPLPEVRLGKTDDIMIGETVVAIGNPLGLENSVTVGVISGKDRSLYSQGGETITDGLLQTDAPINPGNSGGALLNLNGELVGVNVAVVQNSQSIGFATPVEKVKEALEGYQQNQPFTIKHRRRPSILQRPLTTPPGPVQDPSDPFEEMDQMRREMDRLFQDTLNRMAGQHGGGVFNSDLFYEPNFDFKETQEGYTIQLDITGLNQKQIDIEINEQTLTISGERSEEIDETHAQGKISTRRFGSFSKTILLPDDVDTKKIHSKMEGNQLIITLPKRKGKSL